MSEGEFYNIEKILDRRKRNGGYEYKIKWEGYPMNQCTWEPMKNLETVKELVDNYNSLHPIISQKKSKTEVKRPESFINAKRKKEKNENDKCYNTKKEVTQGEKNIQNPSNTNNENKINIKENINEKKYVIDNSLVRVITLKLEEDDYIAKVEKKDQNGNISVIYIPTKELRLKNPWILINFYESKIKFS